MRISDWSSDVCSSDLDGRSSATEQGATDARVVAEPIVASPAPVTISAPLAPAPAVARRAQIPDDREQLQPGDISILVVEDDGAFARVLADLTRRKGYRDRKSTRLNSSH